MKLLDVYAKDGYLFIKTDIGLRRQSLNWRGVELLQRKAEDLIGKQIVTTASGNWSSEEWFATIAEAASLHPRDTPSSSASARSRRKVDDPFAIEVPGGALSNRSNEHVVKVYGPPGTGKTTYLIRQVEAAIASGIEPKEIGFFSYTNKATEEAKAKAVKAFPDLDIAAEFPYFQTLHSLSIRSLRTKAPVMSELQASQFDGEVSVERVQMREGDESSQVTRVKHPVLDATGTARVKKIAFHRYLSELPDSQRWPINKWLSKPKTQHNFPLTLLDIEKCVNYSTRYESFKKDLGVIDYTDMLVKAATDNAAFPHLKLLLIDEAQDLNPLQWELAQVLIDRAAKCFIAGDDDQAICESFGASAEHFVKLSTLAENVVVLKESHRVPPVIHRALASINAKLSDRFPYRKDKIWNPKTSGVAGEIGSFDSIAEFLQSVVIDQHRRPEDVVLLMFARNETLQWVSAILKSKGVSHYAANKLEGSGNTKVRLLTIWGAKGGQAEIAALITRKKNDRQMLRDDPRLEYVAQTRALEKYYVVEDLSAG